MKKYSLRATLIAGLCGLTNLVAWSPGASAAPIAFQVNIAETQHVAENPTDMMAAMMVAWQPQHVLALERKMPFFQISIPDDSTFSPTAELKSITINIGKPLQYSFDFANLVNVSPGVSVAVAGPTAVVGAVKSDAITLTFSGLTKGKAVTLQTDLVADPGTTNLFPDYRQVLFDLNGFDPNNNATFVGTFVDGGLTTTATLLLPDFTMAFPTTFGVASFTSGYMMDHVQAFQARSDANLAPEPASIAMGAMGAFGLILAARRRKSGKLPAELAQK